MLVARGAYYAGNKRSLKAVATTAHCAIDGYRSAIETLPVGMSMSISITLCTDDLQLRSGPGPGPR